MMSHIPALKVLYIIDSLHGYGAERSIVEITRNFVNIKPVFVSVYQEGILSAVLKENKIKHYVLQIDRKYGYSHATNEVAKIYRIEKPEVVHATLYKSEIISRRLKSRFPEILLVGSLISNVYAPGRYSGNSLKHKLKLAYHHFMDRKSAKLVDYFISNSHAIKKINQKALNISETKIIVIHRGRDPKQFRIQDRGSFKERNGVSKNVLVNIGRLILSKGQMDIIKVMPGILNKFPNTILKIAGKGNMLPDLETQIFKLKLNQNISLMGEVEDVFTILSEATLFVFPSYSEGLSGALIEAMMSGITIIASNIPENLECVDDECAFIYSSGNLVELQEKIIYALRNPEESFKKAQAAKTRAMEKFTINQISKEYEEFYSKITSK